MVYSSAAFVMQNIYPRITIAERISVLKFLPSIVDDICILNYLCDTDTRNATANGKLF